VIFLGWKQYREENVRLANVFPLHSVFFYLFFAYGTEAVISLARRQLRKHAGEQSGTIFQMVSFVYLQFNPGFCWRADRRCANA
jgi:hypothetical protein